LRILKHALLRATALAVVGWGTAAAAQSPPAGAPIAVEPAVAEDGLGDGPPPQAAPEPPPAAARGPPPTVPTISDAITGGKLLLEVRARYEDVDQTRIATLTRRGDAFTVRTRLGWETADWHGFKGLMEFEDVRQVGPEHYAVNVPGATTPPLNGADKAKFPLINDPDVTELNRLQLTWTPNAALQVVAGRQRVLIDDQRFVGNVGWRQDEQTFDAVRIDAAYGKFKATYAYVTHVNRVLAELRDWDSDSHLFNATWSLAEPLKLEGFVYALDFGNSAANASVTKGVKATGKTWVGLFQLAYNATYANQGEYRHNTAPYSLDYWGGDIAGTFDIYTAKVSYESLQGNGTRGFTTPLATTHAFQGWADAWVQPLGGNKGFVDGLKDFNLSLNIKPRFKTPYLFNSDIIVRYHDFNDQRTGANLAHEWDAQLQAAINPRLTAALKYADFKRVKTIPLGTAAPPASRTKIWFTLEYKL
jgi:hypothetical protein